VDGSSTYCRSTESIEAVGLISVANGILQQVRRWIPSSIRWAKVVKLAEGGGNSWKHLWVIQEGDTMAYFVEERTSVLTRWETAS